MELQNIEYENDYQYKFRKKNTLYGNPLNGR